MKMRVCARTTFRLASPSPPSPTRSKSGINPTRHSGVHKNNTFFFHFSVAYHVETSTRTLQKARAHWRPCYAFVIVFPTTVRPAIIGGAGSEIRGSLTQFYVRCAQTLTCLIESFLKELRSSAPCRCYFESHVHKMPVEYQSSLLFRSLWWRLDYIPWHTKRNRFTCLKQTSRNPASASSFRQRNTIRSGVKQKGVKSTPH